MSGSWWARRPKTASFCSAEIRATRSGTLRSRSPTSKPTGCRKATDRVRHFSICQSWRSRRKAAASRQHVSRMSQPADRSSERRIEAPMAKRTSLILIPVLAFTMVAAYRFVPGLSSPEQARAESNPEVMRFTLEQNGRRQSLDVRKQAGGLLDVAISVAGACSRAEAGRAKAVAAEGDVEVEVDPDGEGRPTDSFVLTSGGECRVTIRLAAPEGDYAWLHESDCA